MISDSYWRLTRRVADTQPEIDSATQPIVATKICDRAVAVVVLEREFDAASAPFVERALGNVATNVIVDASGVVCLDSATLMVVVLARRRLAPNCSLVLVTGSQVRSVLQNAGLEDHIVISTSLDEALHRLGVDREAVRRTA